MLKLFDQLDVEKMSLTLMLTLYKKDDHKQMHGWKDYENTLFTMEHMNHLA